MDLEDVSPQPKGFFTSKKLVSTTYVTLKGVRLHISDSPTLFLELKIVPVFDTKIYFLNVESERQLDSWIGCFAFQPKGFFTSKKKTGFSCLCNLNGVVVGGGEDLGCGLETMSKVFTPKVTYLRLPDLISRTEEAFWKRPKVEH